MNSLHATMTEIARLLDLSPRTAARLCKTLRGSADQARAGTEEGCMPDGYPVEEYVSGCRIWGSASYSTGGQLVSAPTLSHLWEVAPETVRRLVDAEGLTCFNITGGRRVAARYLKKEVDAFLASRYSGAHQSLPAGAHVDRQLASPKTLTAFTVRTRGVVERALERAGIPWYALGNGRNGSIRYPAKEAVTALLGTCIQVPG